MIKKVGNIILLGTSHVARQSAKEIEEAIENYSPQVIAIELDMERLRNLMSKNQKEKSSFKRMNAIRKDIGLSGYIFAQIAAFVQSKIGKSLGIEPGVDMKTAYVKARDKKIPTALIDQDIRITLRKFSKLGFRRKISMFSSLFFKSFKKEYRERLSFDVKAGVPDEKVIIEMLSIVKKEVPDLYRILIHERNVFMAEKLLKLRENHEGNILAVVGAGHLAGMVEYLEKNYKVPDKISYSFSVEVD